MAIARRMLLGALTPGLDLPEKSAAIDITGLTADSRLVRPGYLFAALPGSAVDGARFAGAAQAAGAGAILAPIDALIGDEITIPIVHADDPRATLARAAAVFYGRQPEVMVAVTGTNGKTSVAAFLRQIWQQAGYQAASIGTIGVTTNDGEVTGNLTTPDPVSLHAMLKDLAEQGVTHAAMEASSHGLAQCRLDGVRLVAGAFTNISRDHLDYHPTFDSYLAAKLRLFEQVLSDGASVVVDVDEPHCEAVVEAAQKRQLKLITVGTDGDSLRLTELEADGFSQKLSITADEQIHHVTLPLVGRFQVSNALVAAGLAIASGVDAADAIAALAQLTGAKGRLDLVAHGPGETPILVDYAHTPDALENALAALRPAVSGRLIVVFGAGGDRDPGKRPLMGAAAARVADILIITDDNPRSENPGDIRQAVQRGAPEATDIGGRAEAIAVAIDMLGEGDALLVAGKGHESGQDFGDHQIPFSDHQVIAEILAERGAA